VARHREKQKQKKDKSKEIFSVGSAYAEQFGKSSDKKK